MILWGLIEQILHWKITPPIILLWECHLKRKFYSPD